MADSVTRPTEVSPETFLAGLAPPQRQADARRLDALFRRATGWEPRMWGPSIVGYGRYDYRYASGRSGSAPAAGFSPRKSELVLYMMPGIPAAAPLLERLGPHRTGAACLYLKRLSAVDEAVLEDLVRLALADLGTRWPVTPG